MEYIEWIIFSLVTMGLFVSLFLSERKRKRREYWFNLLSPVLVLIIIAFVLIWGGIFWW